VWHCATSEQLARVLPSTNRSRTSQTFPSTVSMMHVDMLAFVLQEVHPSRYMPDCPPQSDARSISAALRTAYTEHMNSSPSTVSPTHYIYGELGSLYANDLVNIPPARRVRQGNPGGAVGPSVSATVWHEAGVDDRVDNNLQTDVFSTDEAALDPALFVGSSSPASTSRATDPRGRWGVPASMDANSSAQARQQQLSALDQVFRLPMVDAHAMAAAARARPPTSRGASRGSGSRDYMLGEPLLIDFGRAPPRVLLSFRVC
jgi:hypothetical protein